MRILLACLLSSFAFAEDLYFAQSAAGADTGESCAAAHGAIWFNTLGNWGAGVGKISPGDTAHLCGVITTALTAHGSGSSGSPIVILFEPGAKMGVLIRGVQRTESLVCFFPLIGQINGPCIHHKVAVKVDIARLLLRQKKAKRVTALGKMLLEPGPEGRLNIIGILWEYDKGQASIPTVGPLSLREFRPRVALPVLSQGDDTELA